MATKQILLVLFFSLLILMTERRRPSSYINTNEDEKSPKYVGIKLSSNTVTHNPLDLCKN